MRIGCAIMRNANGQWHCGNGNIRMPRRRPVI
jgi:hypothetical protein